MPREDRTGPEGQGPKTGRGQGKCNPQSGTPVSRGRGGMGSGQGTKRGAAQGAGRGAGQRGRGKGGRKGR